MGMGLRHGPMELNILGIMNMDSNKAMGNSSGRTARPIKESLRIII